MCKVVVTKHHTGTRTLKSIESDDYHPRSLPASHGCSYEVRDCETTAEELLAAITLIRKNLSFLSLPF